MRKLLSLAAFALAAGPSLAQVKPDPPAASTGSPAQAVAADPLAQYQRSDALPAPRPAPFQDRIFTHDDTIATPAGPRGRAGQFWLRGEYLLWWTKGSQLPPLVTTGLPGTTPLPGALGQTGTTVIYGDSDISSRPRSGGRFTAGVLCDPCYPFGFDASYFFLADRKTSFDAASNSALGSSLIARPFFDVLGNFQNAQLVAFPALASGTNILTAGGMGLASGDIRIDTYSRLQGGDINAFCGLCSDCNYWVQMLVGVRYLQLDEGISIIENTRVNPALPAGTPFFGGSTISMTDQFDTRNTFYGGQLGLRGGYRSGRAFLEVQGKLALGVTNQIVDIRGSTAITPPGGATAVTPVGFLASGSNSGRFVRNEFSVVPEVGVNAGYQITDHFRAFVGYNFLYWSSVVRPADQIDGGLSGTQIPTDTRFNPATGPARPGALVRDTGFWVQGVSFGGEFRF